jgi:hypothetical protein
MYLPKLGLLFGLGHTKCTYIKDDICDSQYEYEILLVPGQEYSPYYGSGVCL